MKANLAQKIKKALLLITLPVLAFCLLLSSAACSGNRLPTPTGLNVDPVNLELNWNGVLNAAYYTVRVRGNGLDDQYFCSDNSFDITSAAKIVAGEYSMSVRAEAGSGADYDSSAWSKSITFVREAENGLVYMLTDNNSAFSVAGIGLAKDDIVIPDTYRTLPVTSIADRAFMPTTANAPSVTSITLGSNIKSIGEQAFAGCTNLTSVTLNNGLETIGKQAFQSCNKVTALKIPDSVTEIGEQAFQFCRGIKTLELGSGLTQISANAFNSCSSITTVTIPDNVTYLGEAAFGDCRALTQVTIGDGVTEIGPGAFRKCSALTSLNIGSSVETIGDNAFLECTSLENVTIPDGVKTLGISSFNGCTKLSDVTIGDGIERIGNNAFRGTPLWQQNKMNYLGNWFLGIEFSESILATTPAVETVKDGTVGIADYAYAGTPIVSITLPDTVKYVGEGAFRNCNSLLGVTLGSGVVSIGDHAFRNSNVQSVILGKRGEGDAAIGESSLREIGQYAFAECTSLESITIPDTLQRMGMYAFRNSALWNSAINAVYAGSWLTEYKVNALGAVTLNDGTAGIAEYAFANNTSLTSVAMPDTVKYIGRSAFYNCRALSRIVLSDALTVIEDYTFYHCDNLVIDEPLPSNLQKIGRSAFYKCRLVGTDTDSDELKIPDTVTEIGDYAFYECGFTYEDTSQTEESGETTVSGGIDSVVIGENVKSVGAYAFYGIESLKSVIVGGSVESIGERAFYKCTSLTDITFGRSLKSIGERAFYYCSSLKSVSLPASLTQIGNYAFYRCTSLTDVSLGGTTNIGNYAFFGCSALSRLVLPESVKTIGDQAFRNCSSLNSLVLPEGIQSIGAHAFYGCSKLSFYTSLAEAGKGWSSRWNSSYLPVVWDAEISGGYVVSIEYDNGTVSNVSSFTPLTAPERTGYTFAGWATEENGEVVYTINNMSEIPAGTTLYAVWTATVS